MKNKKMLRVLSTLLSFILIFSALTTNISAIDIGKEDTVELMYPVLYDSAYTATETDALDELLDNAELRNYLFEQFAAFSSYIDISKFKITDTPENEAAIMTLIWRHMPEAFHVYGLGVYGNNGYINRISVSYESWCPADEYPRMYSELKSAASALLDGIENNELLTDVEKALLLHDRLAVWNEYDYQNYLDGAIPRESYTAYGALVNRKSVCNGYAEAYMYLLNRVGIKNKYCSSAELNHGWNIVYIDNTPYYVDVTWDDPVWDVSGQVYHTNFLVSGDIFLKSHQADDYDTSPQDSRYDNYYWRNSETAFQLLNNDLYFIDNKNATLNQVHNGVITELALFDDIWFKSEGWYWIGNYSRLSCDGSNLLLSLPNAVYEFDISNKTLNAIFYPDLTVGSYFNIFGFTYENGYLICDLNDSPYFSSDTKRLYQVRKLNDKQLTTACQHLIEKEIVEKQPSSTCTLLKVFVCSECDKVLRTETVTAPGHSFSEWTVTKESTCAEFGEETRTCSCGEKETRRIARKEHILGDWEVVKAATCTEMGMEAQICTVCGNEILLRGIFPAGHSGEWSVTKEADCTHSGEKVQKCSVCQEILATEIIPATGHSFGAWTVTKQSTCTAKGVETRTCSCGAKETREIAMKAHTSGNWQTEKAPTCTEKGKEIQKCTVCGAVTASRDIAAKGHSGVWSVTKEADCTHSGEKVQKCSVCKVILAKEILPALGHSFGEYVVTKEPTITEKGEKTGTCSVCGEKSIVEIPAIGYKLGDVNGDGKVTIVDAKMILQSVAGSRTLTDTQKKASDLNGDGNITIVDAKWVLQIVANLRDGETLELK